jgi:hypothetical protein
VTGYPRTAIFRYRSEENVDFRTYYGPTLHAFKALPAERQATLNSDRSLVHRYDRNAGSPIAIA